MIAIKNMEMPKDCKKCPLVGTEGNPKELLNPMMCVAIWATKHEIKHCIGGEVLDDCPLIEIEQSEDCVSRQQALKELKESAEHHANDSREEVLLRRDRDIIRALPPVTPTFSKGTTNGDMIKAMFPSVEIHQSGGYTSCLFQPSVMLEDTKSDWWNAPYKGVENDCVNR